MCIPPVGDDTEAYFREMKTLNKNFGLKELSMGMSSDYLIAAKHLSTFVRIGTSVFGSRY